MGFLSRLSFVCKCVGMALPLFFYSDHLLGTLFSSLAPTCFVCIQGKQWHPHALFVSRESSVAQ